MKSIVNNTYFPKNFSSELLVLEEGKGVFLKDINGKEYLDFGAGVAVNALGYGREDLAECAFKQMKKLIHVSNLYTTKPALKLAEKLVKSGPFASVHLGNSGTEANETAIKYARLYSLRIKGEGHHKILSFTGSFHGRTIGALSCTPTEKYQKPFKPLMPGTEVCTYNNTKELAAKLDESYAAVLVEVIQGEGGLASLTDEFAAKLNELCAQYDVLLIVDEVQTGLARTGSLYAYSQAGLRPDIITLSKPLAGGLPLSAALLPKKVNDLIQLGEHGTTFGGGPVTTTVALKVLEKISQAEFMESVKEKGKLLKKLLTGLSEKYSFLGKVKGFGLLQGIELLEFEPKDVIKAALKEGLLVLQSGTNVIRIAPPLIITEDEIKEGIKLLDKVFSKME
jgi:acetylornithine/N-succinyldiaminopimelate aminotransferase